MTTDAAIRVEGLRKSYRDLHVLHGFDVVPGTIFALRGSNGARRTSSTTRPTIGPRPR